MNCKQGLHDLKLEFHELIYCVNHELQNKVLY